MWNNLKASIAAVVRTNNNQEITGANLQNVLNTIVNSVGANATFAGIATPSTNPGTPDGPVFYIACEPGVYSNFNITTVDGLYILENKTGSWVGTRISAAGGTSGTTFTPHVDSDGNLSWTNDGGKPNPETVNIKGPQGDTVILGDGETYKLYNSTGQNTDGAMTQKAVTDKINEIAEGQSTLTFDDEPTAGSNNPVKSNGIKVALDAKQDTLTFDDAPTAESNNPVKSSGVKIALDAKQDTINTVNVEVDSNVGTPSGSASFNGSTLLLSFQNLKGNPGARGLQGERGPQGERGLPGESGVTGDVSGFTVRQTIEPSATYGPTDIAGAASLQATNAEVDKKVDMKLGINILNPSTCTSGKYVNKNNGNLATLSGMWATDYIPVSEDGLYCNTGYSGGAAIGSAVYDANRVYLRSANAKSYTYQEGDGFVRFTLNSIENAQVSVGTVQLDYQPYNPLEGYKGVLSDENKVNVAAGDNLIDPSQLHANCNLLITTGQLYTGQNSYTTSDYFRVTEGVTYYKAKDSTYNFVTVCYYDSQKNYLNSYHQNKESFTAPSGAYYARVSVLNAGVPLLQVMSANRYYTPYSPIGGYDIDGNKIITSTIEFEAISFRVEDGISDNILNPESLELVEHTFIDKTDGNKKTNSSIDSAGVTDYITIDERGLYTNDIRLIGNTGGAYYDINKQYLQGFETKSIPYVNGAAYVRFTLSNNVSERIVTRYTDEVRYVAFAGTKNVLAAEVIPKIRLKIPDESIGIEKVSFSIKDGVSDNILDPSTLTIDGTKYINRNTGSVGTWTNSVFGGYTDYIRIDSRGMNTNCMNNSGVSGGAYYDINKTYISGFTTSVIPYVEGAVYVRFTLSPNVTNRMLSRGTESKPYVAFAGYKTIILPDVLPAGIGGSDAQEIKISLPDKITAVVGDTLQVFFRGCLQVVDPDKYNVVVNCSKGKQFHRYFEYTPNVSDIGSVNFGIKIRDDFGRVLSEKTCTLVTVASPSSPSSRKNILCIGDSLTAGGQWPSEAKRRLVGTGGTPAGKGLSNIVFVGDKELDGTGYCGHSGWSWQDYVTEGRPAFRFTVGTSVTVNVGNVYSHNGYSYTVIEVSDNGTILCSTSSATNTPLASGTLTLTSGSGDSSVAFSTSAADSQNPFWDSTNQKFTFVNYVNTYCNGSIDAVYVLLGGNDTFPWRTDFSTFDTLMTTFADTLHTEYPNCKLKLMSLAVPSMKLMMSGYGASGTGYADVYGILATVLFTNDFYQEFANRDEYLDFVEFVNVSSQVDSDYNMSPVSKAVNTRNSTYTELYDGNTLHPSNNGYYQIADIVYRNIAKEF